VQRGIEPYAGWQGASSIAGPAEEVRLGAFAQTRLGELLDGILLAILVDCEVDGAKGAAPNLLLDQVLVNAVLCGAVIFAIAVLGARIEGFLGGSAGAHAACQRQYLYSAGARSSSSVVSNVVLQWRLVCGR
jgi:hypothetical protein